MTKSTFWTLFFTLNLCFVFIKVYQHNLFVRHSYLKQHLELEKSKQEAKKNHIMVKLLSLKNPERIADLAQKEFGFSSLNPLQVIQIGSDEKK